MFRVNSYRLRFFILFLLMRLFSSAMSNIPALEREISLSVKNEAITQVLSKIAQQSGVIFSYSPQLLKDIAPLSLHVKNKSLREVLASILPLSIEFKAKNNYIILKEKLNQGGSKTKKVSGYVYDASTDKKLANVTVYDKKSLESATTNEYGYYSITVPATNSSLTVNRVSYEDTAIVLTASAGLVLTNISIQAKTDSSKLKDSVAWRLKLQIISSQTNAGLKKITDYWHTLYVSDSLERKFQISFLPFIGTNHKLSGNVINKFSINILGGYSRGTKEFEIGGLFNVDKENVKGIQIGGLFNLVGDSMRGIQIGGLTNINGKKTDGIQIAGLNNMNEGPVKGIQIAGLMNYNEHFSGGTSIAGLLSMNQKVKGLQIAGLSTINDTSQAFSIAGLINLARHHKKASGVAGLINSTQTGESKFQAAILLNKTQHNSGIQLGLINVSDTSSGIPIGFFSIVKKGLHQLELSADELQYFNLNFRTGVPAFYNIVSGSIQPYQGTVLWSFGYGIGTSFRVKNKFRSDITLHVKNLTIGSTYGAVNQRIQLYWGLEYKLKPKISFAFGPTGNLFLVSEVNKFQDLVPSYSRSSIRSSGLLAYYWVGLQVSLRFF